MKNLKTGFVVAILIACALLLFVQRQAQEKLCADNESLTQQIAQLQTDNQSLSNRLAVASNSESLPDGQLNELLKLRGEVGVLRQQTNELGKLRQENQKLHTQAVAQNQSVELSPEDKYTLDHSHAIAAAGVLANAMQKYAKDHNGQFPASIDQLKASGYLGADNLAGNIGLEDFELVNAGLVNDSMPDKIIVRQRVPYQNVNGKWVREYDLADGSVNSQYSDDGNFDAFEQQHSPPPNQ